MATNITVFLSNKLKASLKPVEQAELVKQISEKVETYLGVKSYPTLATSTVSGPEVTINISDVGNITGAKSDFLAWQIKGLIIAFVLLKRLVLLPNDIRVETSLRSVN